jgi:two-component system sensor histidine kinase and response regulator WspE
LTGQSSTVTDQQEEKLPLSILVAGGRDVVSALDEAGLPAAGADVFVAGDGSGAMSELLANAYDVIIIDHSLERIDGLRLVALIRSAPGLATLPVLIVVEEDDELSRLEGRRSGADRALAKPLQADVFASSLGEIAGA